MKFKIDCNIGTFSFESTTSQDSEDVFGVNGLPLTPASTKIVGNYHSFVNTFNSSIPQSPYLITYLDCIRNKNEKVTLVFEHYSQNASTCPEIFSQNIENVIQCGLYGLYHLHYILHTSHGLISPTTIVTYRENGEKNRFKLNHWALNLLTDGGRLCKTWFVTEEEIQFMPLEQILSCKAVKKSDVWALGLTVLSILFPSCIFPVDQIEFLQSITSFDDLLQKLNIFNDFQQYSNEKIKEYLRCSLQPDIRKRSNVVELLKICDFSLPVNFKDDSFTYPVDVLLMKRTQNMNITANSDDDPFSIKTLTLHDIYYLYRIITKDARSDKHHKRILPPILTIPKLIILETESNDSSSETYSCSSEKRSETNLQDQIKNLKKIKIFDIKLLSLETVRARLESLEDGIFCPLLFSPDITSKLKLENRSLSSELPLSIREMDFDYQCQRLMTFKPLLNGYPYLRMNLISESQADISPHLRSQIWACLLNVQWSDLLLYERIDKQSPTSTDRQIDVDIPRCHQYNDLLASEEGHRKLTRILKAWLAFNEKNGEVYWQGLDSLAAPFVLLNFNNEPLAFACFYRFVKKYLSGFFQKDNSTAIQEYLVLFQIITTFHDPIMSHHFFELGFVPDLYSISWFLTIFTHILPLYQIVQLWDTLLLGNDSFALFIGLSILHQLRDRILDFTFNDCILTFSDLPQIDIDRCARSAIKFFKSTPKSISKRGLWKLEDLKEYSRLPRLDIDDLIEMMKNYKMFTNEDPSTDHIMHSIMIVDCRTADDIQKFGCFDNSFTFEEYLGMIMQEEKPTRSRRDKNGNKNEQSRWNARNQHSLLVVVNSIEKTMELIDIHKIPRVAYLEIFDHVPKSLR